MRYDVSSATDHLVSRRSQSFVLFREKTVFSCTYGQHFGYSLRIGVSVRTQAYLYFGQASRLPCDVWLKTQPLTRGLTYGSNWLSIICANETLYFDICQCSCVHIGVLV